jgi:N-acetylated-alpha-linked acidic dipeptidase
VKTLALARALALALVATFAAAECAAAQTMTGYSPSNADKQKIAEAAAIARPDPSKAQAHSKSLSDGPHVAGTPGQARTRDYVIDQMKALGLQTEVRAYDIWMPHLVEARVWRVSPSQQELDLRELRLDRRLRDARFTWRQRARQDRRRAIWPKLPRHQSS